MTKTEETALRNEFYDKFTNDPANDSVMWKVVTLGGPSEIADYWLAKMKARESEEKSRIASRLEHMFANAPETWFAIKSIIYAP